MKSNLFGLIRDLNIRYKLMLSYLALIVIPMGLLLWLNIYYIAKETQKRALYSIEQALNQAKSYIEFKIQFIRNSLNYIALNNTVIELISRDPAEFQGNIGLWAIDAQRLNRIFNSALIIPPSPFNDSACSPKDSHASYYRTHLYMKKGLATIFENDDFIDLNKLDKSSWLERVLANKDVITWFPTHYFPNGNFIYAVRNITDEQDITHNIGAIRVDLPLETFTNVLQQAMYSASTTTIIVNDRDEIICHAGDVRYPEEQLLRDLAQDRFNLQGIQKATYNHREYLIGIRNIENTDWKLVLITPFNELMLINDKYRWQIILMFVIIALLTIPFAFFISASATRRLARLVNQMKRVEVGDLTPIAAIGCSDEIGVLTEKFNDMLRRISLLLDEKYAYGKEIKNLELKALQAQINPHFLYNTLDLINWISIKSKVPKICKIIRALSRFYKLSLGKGEDFVQIRQEIEHIKAYIEIQNIRFNDAIHLSIDIDNEIMDCTIPKLTLQPLVENAIIHGILEKEEETGTVTITGELVRDTIRLRIEDDGVGMPAGGIPPVLAGEPYRGYGIMNINDRLKLSYGNEYGLSFQSEPGRGTTVTIAIPVRKSGNA